MPVPLGALVATALLGYKLSTMGNGGIVLIASILLESMRPVVIGSYLAIALTLVSVRERVSYAFIASIIGAAASAVLFYRLCAFVLQIVDPANRATLDRQIPQLQQQLIVCAVVAGVATLIAFLSILGQPALPLMAIALVVSIGCAWSFHRFAHELEQMTITGKMRVP